MIRESNSNDLEQINEIGLQINTNFKQLYNLDYVIKQDYTHIYVYEENNVILGFLHIENHFEVTDIINIVTKLGYHKKGIATKLMQYLLDNDEYERIMLEVRKSNDEALNLYKKFAFKQINIRKNYYGNEDAIIMERKMNNE
ncbi:MAG TPA: GNAT family N-acetyltransferase [Bacilli bacterium]|jgi:ribosomal-protein-alanine N-acetyltransferase|nr:GNAT family N-acetyltransferase [Bacilli bacterium]HPZ23387.1 GNAT family N-acetyltransferase [Bacilli bacterium]HQC83463.1 GNAT family N-acetyltransferase [Bacilli bacterium]